MLLAIFANWKHVPDVDKFALKKKCSNSKRSTLYWINIPITYEIVFAMISRVFGRLIFAPWSPMISRALVCHLHCADSGLRWLRLGKSIVCWKKSCFFGITTKKKLIINQRLWNYIIYIFFLSCFILVNNICTELYRDVLCGCVGLWICTDWQLG